jgi:hypothetical protein
MADVMSTGGGLATAGNANRIVAFLDLQFFDV